jgi:hypothetical protein
MKNLRDIVKRGAWFKIDLLFSVEAHRPGRHRAGEAMAL